MNPPKRIRVLIAEDRPDDAELVIIHLRQEGYVPEFEIVTSAEAFKTALERQSWDLILSDYSIGVFGAPMAQRVLKDMGLDVPFIIVSGTIGEDAAVAALRAGANDFISKGRLARLAPAIERELREAANRRERRDQERAARTANDYHAMLLDSLYDAVIAVDPGLVVTAWNRAAEYVYGWQRGEAIGRHLGELVSTLDDPRLKEMALQTSQAGQLRLELMQRTRSGAELDVESTSVALRSPEGVEIGYVFVNRDISARRRAEAENRHAQDQLMQSQKMEAVGRLASGVAHEINTPVQFIGDNVRFLKDATSSLLDLLKECAALVPPERREELAQCEDRADLSYLQAHIPKAIDGTLNGVGRVSTIVRSMKEFAHPDKKEMAETDLNRSIQATLDIARNEYKYVAELETELADLPPVTCHAGDINQVVLNLVVNAAHAISDVVEGTHTLGKIKVATRRDGEYVVISISDTGTGIPDDVKSKIFEPFFTTKALGRGTGQGLALARTVIGKHQGTIHFDTKLGQGTTFFLRLPISPASIPEHIG
jgi:PAS domain S-box-containing protein